MAEAVVSVVLESVRDFTIQEAKFLSGVSRQVEAAQTELEFMQGFLKDADARQGQDTRVQICVARIRDAAYDLEDIIETYGLKVDSKKKKRGLKNVLKRFACIFKEWVDVHRIGNEIENITTKISALRSSLQSYNIKEIRDRDSGGGESSMQLHERQGLLRRSYSHVVERDVVGLENNVEGLVMHVLKDENRHQVVSIWGMGGLGKTTLAGQVYHHKKVRQHFHSFAWVCVSQRCQVRNVWEGILFKLISATKEQKQEIKEMTYDEIAKKLFLVMKEMRCLVILDDIWHIETWNLLKVAFPNVETESTILLTTRNQAVASLPNRNVFLHKLQPLNENESWELLVKKAIPARAEIDLGMYRDLGRKMLQYCKGLPLAITVLAGVLVRKNSIREWERVYENVHEYISRGIGHEEEYGGVSQVLALSYDDLPYYLKLCFLYLGHYPEDSEFLVSKLTKLWVAEGLISLRQQRHGSRETMEDIARDCLSELVERCLVQVGTSGSTGTIKGCRIHDLVRDMCLLKAKEESFLQMQENTSSVAAEAEQLGKIRRLAIYLDEKADRLVSSRDETNGHVRSLLFFGLREWRPKNEKGLLSPLMDFTMLRVLKVEGLNEVKVELPSEIGNMVHLRFLSVKDSRIKTLPPSLGNLVCLQTLDCCVRNDYVVVPNVIKKMKQLRHLYLPWNYRVKGKLELSTLGHLQTLGGLSSKYCDLKDVGRLTNLRKLKITLSSSLQNLEEILKSTGSTLNRIRSLIFWNNSETNGRAEQAMQIVSSCRGIYKLRLKGPIAELPKELHNYPNLTKLELNNCGLKEDQMGILEKLPNLTILKLFEEAFEENTTKILVFSKGGFPSLEFLDLWGVDGITELRLEEGAMPRLCRLNIKCCLGLTTLPDGLRYLTNLRELTIARMSRELHGRIQEDGEDFYKIQHVPSLVMMAR
ncbi:PREDICTED: putative disease resistance protein At1g50180 isoform X2 [Prunus mume]|uniref:Disease resistance protein At1g50180 isoform X2 n=1 Tax=Prunus mume TaxID=102107 RepID=A0ABM0NFS9_PRUMU|nr:PREDICTED: putative disease resistance protein At1g50180 isoform X2 [Prunus mume]